MSAPKTLLPITADARFGARVVVVRDNGTLMVTTLRALDVSSSGDFMAWVAGISGSYLASRVYEFPEDEPIAAAKSGDE